jgi:hypothetical protein
MISRDFFRAGHWPTLFAAFFGQFRRRLAALFAPVLAAALGRINVIGLAVIPLSVALIVSGPRPPRI